MSQVTQTLGNPDVFTLAIARLRQNAETVQGLKAQIASVTGNSNDLQQGIDAVARILLASAEDAHDDAVQMLQDGNSGAATAINTALDATTAAEKAMEKRMAAVEAGLKKANETLKQHDTDIGEGATAHADLADRVTKLEGVSKTSAPNPVRTSFRKIVANAVSPAPVADEPAAATTAVIADADVVTEPHVELRTPRKTQLVVGLVVAVLFALSFGRILYTIAGSGAIGWVCAAVIGIAGFVLGWYVFNWIDARINAKYATTTPPTTVVVD